MAEHAVQVATTEREQAVVDVLTLAFAQDPMARWALPDACCRHCVPCAGISL